MRRLLRWLFSVDPEPVFDVWDCGCVTTVLGDTYLTALVKSCFEHDAAY